MNATIYLDPNGFERTPTKLDEFEIPIKNKEFNERIDSWRDHKLELDKEFESSFFIEIKSADLFGKIIVYSFKDINKIFFLYNILKDHNLLNDFNMYWKYHARANLKEVNSGEFYTILKEILKTAFPDYKDDIINEDFNKEIFLEKIPGTSEYLYLRQNDTCEFLKNKTGFDWEYFDPSIIHWGFGYTNESVSFQPDTYCSINYDPDIPAEKLKREDSCIKYYHGKYQIRVINNIFEVLVETRIFNKIREVKDNCDLLYYMAPNNFDNLTFMAVAYSWDEVFDFIKRVDDFEHKIRIDNDFIKNLDAYLKDAYRICNENNPFDLEVKKINKELQMKVDKKLENLKRFREDNLEEK